MAVPTSGALNMLNMAREALYGTWGSGTITGPISLYDMINGGNANGSGNSYPAINQTCLPNPANRGSYIELLQIYKVTSGTTTGPFTHYANPSDAAGSITTASQVVDTYIIYSNASLTATIPAHGSAANSGWYQNVSGLAASQMICGDIYGSSWDTTSTGAMDNLRCPQP